MAHGDDRGAKRTEPETQSPELLALRRRGRNRPVLVVLTGPQLGQRVILSGPVTIGRDPEADLVLDDEGAAWHHAMVQPRGDGRWEIVDLTGGQGTEVNGEAVEERALSPDDQLIVGHTVVRFEFHDPIEQAYAHAIVERLFRDDLTGLPSRRKFDNDLRTSVAAARRTERPVAIAILDIDRLKPINDRFGHLAGSEVIAKVGRLVLEVLGPSCFACRLGGDEFGLAWLGRDLEGARREVDRLRQRIATEPFRYAGEPLTVRVSGGMALFPHDGATPTELLRAADQALYQAKAGGGDRIVARRPSPPPVPPPK
ncbi:MAG: GGDEF domain-containing protein [Sandaracinaceae bacterium]